MHTEGPSRKHSEFRRHLDADWTAWLHESPELATVVGFPGLNDRWTDDSEEGIARRRALLADCRRRLAEVDRTRLSPGDQLDFDIYSELLETATAGLEFGDDPFPYSFGMPHNLWMPLNQMEGVHVGASDILELQPRSRAADYGPILDRLRRLDRAVDQNRALLIAGRRRGYLPPRVAIRGVPDQIRSLVPADAMESALLHPFVEFPTAVPEADRPALVAEAKSVYDASVRPAFERLLEYLTEEYLPACRESVGASALPNGAASYAHHVRGQTTTAYSPKEIHEIGLAEVRRIRTEMEAVMTRTGFQGTFREFLTFLKTDPRFFFARPDDLIEAYRALAKKTDPALSRLFGRLPRLQYGVLPVPEFKAPSSPTAYYMGGSPVNGRPGYFFANTYDLKARPKWEMEALALHESVPGHHLQIALAQELDEVPEFRRYSGPTAFVEGWGLYAESLGEELGLYKDPYSKVGQLTFDMWRSIRLVVDTGMHALGWSRDQAIDFFRQNTGKSDLDISVEVDRYIVWPGQALAYKIGQLKFRELRGRAESRLGDRFDVRRFHDLVLEEGALSLARIEDRVTAWVESEARAAGPRAS